MNKYMKKQGLLDVPSSMAFELFEILFIFSVFGVLSLFFSFVIGFLLSLFSGSFSFRNLYIVVFVFMNVSLVLLSMYLLFTDIGVPFWISYYVSIMDFVCIHIVFVWSLMHYVGASKKFSVILACIFLAYDVLTAVIGVLYV
ncbi:MAG: hypothetical protein J6M18_03370 [Actinomycetaceae bacterium]|nr:hypothetical protein [Actinomycetaceae bacterium]